MNIVWFSWKDIRHPEAGGAETISHKLMTRLVADGHTVTLITALYPGAAVTDNFDGIHVLRGGNRFTVYLKARGLFKNLNVGKVDLVIDEMNTIPFAAAFYTKTRTVLLTYQLARQVWFHQMIFPLSVVGFLIEPLYLRLISKKYSTVLTESQSTKDDLVRFGFSKDTIRVFRVSIDTPAITKLIPKKDNSSVLFLGAFRPMKRPLDAIKAFEFARDNNHSLRLVMAGSNTSRYGQKVISYAASSRHSDAITILGRVSSEERLQLMRDSTVILVTSVKEGWGLIVTEAASQGTPSVAYDADGLKDSIQDKVTGLLSKSGNPKCLGDALNKLVSNDIEYNQTRFAAWEFSKQFTEHSLYTDFYKSIGL